MKKNLIIFSLLSISLSAVSQTNLDFENWTDFSGYEDPNDWSTYNAVFAPMSGPYQVEKSSDAHSGLYSCQITTKLMDTTDSSPVLPGLIEIGDNPSNPGTVPYTSRPDSVIFWYKYTAVGGDMAGFSFQLNSGQEVIGSAFNFLNPQASWKRIGMKVEYQSQSNPDCLKLMFLSSAASSPVPGSKLKIDAIEFKMPGSVGLDEHSSSTGIILHPNPVVEKLYIKLEENTSMEIYDIHGNRLLSFRPNNNNEAVISVENYPSGVYLLRTGTGAIQRFVVRH